MKSTIAALLVITLSVLGWFLWSSGPSTTELDAAPHSLTVATEGGYPPFNYVDESGRLAGFDVDIAMALCEAMNASCTVVRKDWNDLLPGLQRGEYDMIVASMANTPERRSLADFSNCYYRSRSSFVGRKGIMDTVSQETVKGKTMATQADTVQAEYLRSHFSQVAKIVYTTDIAEMYELLSSGGIDLALIDSLNILEFLTSEQGRDFEFIGEALPPEDVSSCATIAVPKGSPLRQRVNEAIDKIRLSGVYDAINREYFPFSIY